MIAHSRLKGFSVGDSIDEMSVDELGRMLVLGAEGSWEHEAAAQLIVEHGTWLGRADFRRYIGRHGTGSSLFILWGDVWRDVQVGALRGTHEELLIIKIAASFRGYLDVSVNRVENVDPRTMRVIMRAMAAYAGYGDQVDGWCSV
jgi:hypothetical protein